MGKIKDNRLKNIYQESIGIYRIEISNGFRDDGTRDRLVERIYGTEEDAIKRRDEMILLQQKKISQAEKLLSVFSAKDRLKGSVAVSFAEFYGFKKEFAKAIDVLSKVKDKENANDKRLRYSRMCDYALRNNDGKLALVYYQKARAAVNGKWRLPAYEHRIKLLHPAAKF